MKTQAEKGTIFRELHERDSAFIIPNPYDAGSAKLLEYLGFEAVATSSAGYAFTLGKPDNAVGRERMIEHGADLVAAVDIPVSADLENGFGDDPETASETIRLAAATGLVGGSIEDSTGRTDDPIYEFDHAVERVRASVEATRSLPFTFTLTARCENYLVGRPDINDTIRRLQAYQEAGADVLFAPGLTTKEDISSVIASVDRPVNVIMGLSGVQMSLAELSDLGVKRISVGSSLARAAFGAFLRAGQEMRDHGTFIYANEAVPFQQINSIFKG